MITMKTGSKTPVKFVFSDDVSETTINIQPDDPSDTIRAKLQRVLELEGEAAGLRARTTATMLGVSPDDLRLPVRQPGAALSAARETFEPLWDAAEAEKRLAAQQTVGWETADLDALPEA